MSDQQQPPVPTAQNDLADMLAEQRALTQLGLRDLQNRWEMQPDLQLLQVGAGNPAEQTIRGNPEDSFHGVAVLNNTEHTLTIGFNSGAAIGAPITVPPHSLFVWPVEYTNLSIASDVAAAAEGIQVLRLRYPPGSPFLAAIPQKYHEPWSEEEQNEAAAVKLKLAGKPGRKIIVTSVIAEAVNSAAVGANAIVELSIKSAGNTIFRQNLVFLKSEGVAVSDRFVSGPINLTLREGEELLIEVTAGPANGKVIVNASGYIE